MNQSEFVRKSRKSRALRNKVLCRIFTGLTVPVTAAMTVFGTVCWVNEARKQSVFEYIVSGESAESKSLQSSDRQRAGEAIAAFPASYVYGKEETDSSDDITEENTENTQPSQPEFIWPVEGGCISDKFISDRNHKGLDIAAESGSDIYAAGNGTVSEAGWNDGGYGYYVMISHEEGYVTLYAHASEVFVSAGDTVSQGDVIAAVGSTGDSTGSHCHFEVRSDGEFCNPENYLVK